MLYQSWHGQTLATYETKEPTDQDFGNYAVRYWQLLAPTQQSGCLGQPAGLHGIIHI